MTGRPNLLLTPPVDHRGRAVRRGDQRQPRSSPDRSRPPVGWLRPARRVLNKPKPPVKRTTHPSSPTVANPPSVLGSTIGMTCETGAVCRTWFRSNRSRQRSAERVGIEQLHRAVPLRRPRSCDRRRGTRPTCRSRPSVNVPSGCRPVGVTVHVFNWLSPAPSDDDALAVASNRDGVDTSRVSDDRRTDRSVIGDRPHAELAVLVTDREQRPLRDRRPSPTSASPTRPTSHR